MNLVIASDHAGFEAKKVLKSRLASKGYNLTDVGTDSLEPCDYPLFAKKAAELVSNKKADFGILICSSGEGVMIAANKVKGVRAGIGYNDEVAKLLRKHNDANMIAFGAKFMSVDEMEKRVEIFLKAEFEGGRHQRRVDEIE